MINFTLRFRWVSVGFFVSMMMLVPVVEAANFLSFQSQVYTGPHKVNAINTEHFTIEYSVAIAAGQDVDRDGIPDLVENVATYAEISWDKEVKELGFPNPLVNYAKYKNGINQARIFLILDDTDFYLLEGSLGVTSIDTTRAMYMAIDPTIADSLLKVTVAHELAHVIQFSYQGDFIGFDQDLNFAEQTAVAVEDYVFGDVNDYRNYLRHFFDNPDYSILTGVVPENTLFEYALVIWPRFLVEYFDDWKVLPQVVQAYFDDPVPNVWDSFEAYKKVVESTYEKDLGEVYQDFTWWNYLVRLYREGTTYPKVKIAAQYAQKDYPVLKKTVGNDQLPALFGANYLQFGVSSFAQGMDLKLTFEKPAEIDLGVMVLPETEGAYLVEDAASTIFEAGSITGVVTIPVANGVNLFTVIVSPLSSDPSALEPADDAFSIGYSYVYSAELGQFLAGDIPEFKRIYGDGSDDLQALKGGDDFGANLPEVSVDLSTKDALTVNELAVSSSTDSSVSLRWSRPSGGKVAGYNVYYGSVAGGYGFTEHVSGAFVTHLTLKNLDAGQYYFAVKGVDAKGVVSSAYSNEVVVKIGEGQGAVSTKDFLDVPLSHRNHDAIDILTQLEVFQGYPDGSFKPNRSINRAELMKILAINDFDSADAPKYKNCFPDVTTEWFAPYVCYGADQGWVQGYEDGLFHPERTVSRAEALKILYKSAEVVVSSVVSAADIPYDDVFGSAWYAPYVAQAYRDGLLENTEGKFDPNGGQRRAQVAEMLYRYFVILWFDEEAPYSSDLGERFKTEWAVFWEL